MGRVIGVDMTPEMIDRARENARKNRYTNVEFRLGEIEAAGFQRVDVVSESSFPADFVLESSHAQEVIRKLNISRRELTEAIGSVISLSVRAVKEEEGLRE